MSRTVLGRLQKLEFHKVQSWDPFIFINDMLYLVGDADDTTIYASDTTIHLITGICSSI